MAAACLLVSVSLTLGAATPAASTTVAHRRARVSARPAASLQDALAQATRRPPSGDAGLSIEIADLATGEPVFERNPQSPQTLASVSKIFSTAAALQGLGRDYRFKTSLYRSGNIDSGVLAGSLLVVGGGDPNISGRFYDQRHSRGLRSVGRRPAHRGDHSHRRRRDSQQHVLRFRLGAPGWPAGQEARWYQAPVAALSYNDNCISVLVGPGEKPGSPGARLDRAARRISCGLAASVEDDLVPKGAPRGRRPKLRQPGGLGRPAGLGKLRSGALVVDVIAIDDPPRFFGAVLRERLEERGIHIDGQVGGGVRPDPTWGLVAETESGLLPSIAVANKRSQSFYAEQIFKTLGGREKRGRDVGEGPRPRETIHRVSGARSLAL